LGKNVYQDSVVLGTFKNGDGCDNRRAGMGIFTFWWMTTVLGLIITRFIFNGNY
jgi:hypothetical protein